MSGEKNLQIILADMNPILDKETYVFLSVPHDKNTAPRNPILSFRENQGQAYIASLEDAETCDLPYIYRSKRITLTVHSSLEAVGFLAAITTKLAAQGISVNPVSAFFHDHLFVPEQDANKALETLLKMQQEMAIVSQKQA